MTRRLKTKREERGRKQRLRGSNVFTSGDKAPTLPCCLRGRDGERGHLPGMLPARPWGQRGGRNSPQRKHADVQRILAEEVQVKHGTCGREQKTREGCFQITYLPCVWGLARLSCPQETKAIKNYCDCT